MAAKELKKAAENRTCPACYQVFKSPKYLPCHHSCCEECLEKMQRKKSKITCPECRLETTVPPGGVRDLPSNFLINCLVDELILKRTVDGEEEVQCDKCDVDDPVVSYCPDCGDFLCHVCNASHKRDKGSRGHKIVPLTELRANKGTTLEVKAKIPSCNEHEYELKHYCETCEELVCLYCTMKGHSDHSHDTVKNMAGKHRNKLKEITAPVDEMIRGLAEAHNNIDKTRKNIKQRSNEVDKEIDQYYDELVQQLMEQKQQIKQQLSDTVSQKEKALTMQLEEIEFAQGELFSMKELKDAVEKSSDHVALSAKKQIITYMTKLSEKYTKINTQSAAVEMGTIQFIKDKQYLPLFSELKFMKSHGKQHKTGWFPANRVELLTHGKTSPTHQDSVDTSLSTSSSHLSTHLSQSHTSNISGLHTTHLLSSSSSLGPTASSNYALALYSYTADNTDELTFYEGSVITIINKEDPGWWKGEMNGQVGLVPANYVQELDDLQSNITSTRWKEAVSPAQLSKMTSREVKRQEAIFELITTENSYVQSLKLVNEVFFQPLCRADVLSKIELIQVLVNWPELIKCNSSLLRY